MKTLLSFDDVLLTPQFSEIISRKDVDTSTILVGQKLQLPIISSNMDTVTNSLMAFAMAENGGIGALHRFCTIDENVLMFLRSTSIAHPIVSIGLGNEELARAEALYRVGANIFLIDVAHGASQHVVQQTKQLKQLLHHSAQIIVGNFATASSVDDFNYRLGFKVDAYKIGIGGGSHCSTRVVTGAGWPTLASLLDCSRVGVNLIADGGIRNSGDFAKAMAIRNVKAVMLGRLLAGTDEAPGEIIKVQGYLDTASTIPAYKKYRGSASLESYQVQGKIAEHRTPEGEASLVPYTGPVKNVLQNLSSGLRSSMSYVGAKDIIDFQERVEFVQVTQNGYIESTAHGKK